MPQGWSNPRRLAVETMCSVHLTSNEKERTKLMKRRNLFPAFALAAICLGNSSAWATQCNTDGFNGGMPTGVTSLTVSTSDINSVTTSSFTTSSVQQSATDGDGVETFNKFVFGADAIQQLTDAGITLGSGVKISGVFDGATIDTVCE